MIPILQRNCLLSDLVKEDNKHKKIGEKVKT